MRYPRNEVPAGQGNKQWETDAWKGERVNAQAVLWTRQPLKNVRIAVSDLKCGKNVIPASATTASFVGYVWTDELNKDRKSGCSDRPNKADWILLSLRMCLKSVNHWILRRSVRNLYG